MAITAVVIVATHRLCCCTKACEAHGTFDDRLSTALLWLFFLFRVVLDRVSISIVRDGVLLLDLLLVAKLFRINLSTLKASEGASRANSSGC
jgi:hypothetical protein